MQTLSEDERNHLEANHWGVAEWEPLTIVNRKDGSRADGYAALLVARYYTGARDASDLIRKVAEIESSMGDSFGKEMRD